MLEPKSDEYGIPCPICYDFVAKNQRGLRQHITKKHPNYPFWGAMRKTFTGDGRKDDEMTKAMKKTAKKVRLW